MEKQWFNKSIEEVKEELKVGSQGLSDEQVKEKRFPLIFWLSKCYT